MFIWYFPTQSAERNNDIKGGTRSVIRTRTDSAVAKRNEEKKTNNYRYNTTKNIKD
jgi:hypothetical protein